MILVTSMLLGSMVGVLAAPASAALDDEWHPLRNVQTNLCLDGDAHGNAYALPCSPGNQYQMWDWTESPDFNWKQANTKRCLNGNPSTRKVTTSHWFWGCGNMISNIKWYVEWTRPGQFQVVLWNTDWCLDSNNEPDPSGVARKVFLSECNVDDLGQSWRYTW
ncbi:RICIN domain-containing protein [Nonomuraea lactucae]|uniref:RICIN domain-containing protein n=1 Tax=Nonomuraea lactucae TaxID=2249762 RepID=UPI0013B439A4|nr:ricin-type beta-trefoil lectin domain protein [Nonomuraea lactucae]